MCFRRAQAAAVLALSTVLAPEVTGQAQTGSLLELGSSPCRLLLTDLLHQCKSECLAQQSEFIRSLGDLGQHNQNIDSDSDIAKKNHGNESARQAHYTTLP